MRPTAYWNIEEDARYRSEGNTLPQNDLFLVLGG